MRPFRHRNLPRRWSKHTRQTTTCESCLDSFSLASVRSGRDDHIPSRHMTKSTKSMPYRMISSPPLLHDTWTLSVRQETASIEGCHGDGPLSMSQCRLPHVSAEMMPSSADLTVRRPTTASDADVGAIAFPHSHLLQHRRAAPVRQLHQVWPCWGPCSVFPAAAAAAGPSGSPPPSSPQLLSRSCPAYCS